MSIQYQEVERPPQVRTRESGPNPHAEGATKAKQYLDAGQTEKALQFRTTVRDLLTNLAYLRRAGRDAGVSIKTDISNGNGAKVAIKSNKVEGDYKSDDVVTVQFWAVPLITRPRTSKTDTAEAGNTEANHTEAPIETVTDGVTIEMPAPKKATARKAA